MAAAANPTKLPLPTNHTSAHRSKHSHCTSPTTIPRPDRPGTSTYIDANIASIVSGVVQATLSILQQQPGIGNGTGGLHLSGKTAKILNRTNRFSLLGFCGFTIQDDIPKIFRILDSNEDPTTKFQALKDLLILAQQGNTLINFMLHKETFKDIKQHMF